MAEKQKITFILGKARSQKSSLILSQFQKELNEKRRPLLLLPSRYLKDRLSLRLTRERKTLTDAALSTLSSLSEEILKLSGKDFPKISDFEAFLTVKALFDQNQNKMRYFRELSSSGTAVKLLYSLISEIRSSVAFDPNFSLQSYAKKIQNPEKWADIALLYSLFDEKLKKFGLFDSHSLLVAAGLELKNGVMLPYNSFFIDGFYDFTEGQFAFLKSLIRYATDKNNPVFLTLLNAPFELLDENQKRFFSAFPDAEILKTTESSAAAKLAHAAVLHEKKTECRIRVTLLQAFGKYRESELIANEIKRLHVEEKIPYGKIAVITARPDDYKNLTESCFKKYGVPYFQSRDERLTENPTIRFLLRLFEIALEGTDNAGIESVLRSGYPISENAEVLQNFSAVFDNYQSGKKAAWEKAVQAKRKRLQAQMDESLLDEDSEYDYFEVKKQIDRFEEFQEAFLSFLEKLFPFAESEMLSSEAVSGFFAKQIQFFSIREVLLGSPFSASEYTLPAKGFMAFRKLKENLVSLTRALSLIGMEQFSQNEALSLMTALLGDVRYRYRYFPQDSVQILSPYDSRGMNFDAVFIPGLNEKEFPGRAAVSIAENSERLHLNAISKRLLLESDERKLDLEKLDFFTAVSRTNSKLYLCHTPFDATGEKVLPSLFLRMTLQSLCGSYSEIPSGGKSDLFRILPGEDWLRISSVKAFLQAHLKDFQKEPEILKKIRMIHPQMESVFSMKENIESVRRANEKPESKNAFSLGKIYFNESEDDRKLQFYLKEKIKKMQLSASRLEKAAKCRYAFFLRYLLSARPEEIPRPEIPMTLSGLFLHRVLHLYVKSTADFKLSELPDEDLLSKAIEEAFAEFSGDFEDSSLIAWERENYRKILKKFVHFEKKLRYGKPSELEAGFENTEIEIAEKRTIKVSGKIDRIDTESGSFAVTDYKSGGVSHFDEAMRRPLGVLQALLYAKAYLQNTGKTQPAVIRYASIQKAEKFDLFPYKKNEGSVQSFSQLWNQKASEIAFLLGLLEEGDFSPFISKSDFERRPDLLEFYQPFWGKREIDPEDKYKCTYCEFKKVCLRSDKKIRSF